VVQWSQPQWARPIEQAQSLVQIQGPQNQSLQNRGEEAEAQLCDEWQDAADASISRAWLLTEPLAAQRRLVKAIGENARIPLGFRHVEEILRFAGEHGPSGKELSLPRGWQVRREHEAVTFLAPDPRAEDHVARDYEYLLSVPGRVLVSEAGLVVEALLLPAQGHDAEYNPQQLLDAELLSAQLTLRNWRAGDRFWPAHTKGPKKIKELLQERHLVGVERRLWPVVLCGDEVVWMRGFAVPAGLRARAGRAAVWIRGAGFAAE
jgi:tRNA(Ile)-lysidine synthetase-like protein